MAVDTRQRIKDQAMALFVARGVDAVSVRDIAAAVGMKAPNLYAHFRSRDDLVHELFAEGYAAYGAMLTQAAADAPDFATKLDRMIRLACRLHDEDTLRFRFLLLTQHASLSGIESGGEDNPMDFLQRNVQAAIDSGELPPGNAALTTAMLVGLVVQTATFLFYGRLREPMQTYTDVIAGAARTLAFGSKISLYKLNDR
jgi:AcrR family transcriptional regulator